MMKKIILSAFLFSFFVPTLASAAEIRIDAHKVSVKIGEEFIADVIVNSAESINALEGTFSFPADMLTVRRIQDGGSSVNFWIDEPREDAPGKIVFSGITPGGFSGPNSLAFSILFVATQEGDAPLTTENLRLLQNDGNATEVSSTAVDTVIHIDRGDSRMRKITEADTFPPEDFTPTIASNTSIFDGKYFLVFATQDKGTGIDHYEVREGAWGWFRKAESPYALINQKLDKDIYVKAVDEAGNERIAIVPAHVHSVWWERYGIFVILIMLVAIALVYKRPWIRFTK
jgi:hypothetical protein